MKRAIFRRSRGGGGDDGDDDDIPNSPDGGGGPMVGRGGRLASSAGAAIMRVSGAGGGGASSPSDDGAGAPGGGGGRRLSASRRKKLPGGSAASPSPGGDTSGAGTGRRSNSIGRKGKGKGGDSKKLDVVRRGEAAAGGSQQDGPGDRAGGDDRTVDYTVGDNSTTVDVFKQTARARGLTSASARPGAGAMRKTMSIEDSSVGGSALGTGGEVVKPSYRVYTNVGDHVVEEGDEEEDDDDGVDQANDRKFVDENQIMAKHIETSAGTERLNRILSKTHGPMGYGQHNLHEISDDDEDLHHFHKWSMAAAAVGERKHTGPKLEKITNPDNLQLVGHYAARVVIPPLKVDRHSIGGQLLENYPDHMQQEALLSVKCTNFETTGPGESVPRSALQYPDDYKDHKRSLGAFGGTKGRNKYRYVILARSTNKPVVPIPSFNTSNHQNNASNHGTESLRTGMAASATMRGGSTRDIDVIDGGGIGGGGGSERADYHAMFVPGRDDEDEDIDPALLVDEDDEDDNTSDLPNSMGGKELQPPPQVRRASANVASSLDPHSTDQGINHMLDKLHSTEEEVSSFPVLVCMTVAAGGIEPDIRKMVRLDHLTTVQDLHAAVVQLAFSNGDTIRLDFGASDDKTALGSMEKDRFIWSLLQLHAMLCVTVVEQNAIHLSSLSGGASGGGYTDRMFLPPLNVRNIDRADLQYVATVNGFLKRSETLRALLERHRDMLESDRGGPLGGNIGDRHQRLGEEKLELEEMDALAYDLMMGNIATRITLFQSEEERNDAEEILNNPEWTELLGKDDTNALNVAERLGLMLQGRMRDLEAETCRRLIAWEDEKHFSVTGKSEFLASTDERDSVDALALASLFETLRALDGELQQMEDWLQDRAAAIKPLTDDCAHIEEESRQLKQQKKSYVLLSSEIHRLLVGLNIDADMEKVLKSPASALVYNDDGLVDVEASEGGVEQICEAGNALLETIDDTKVSGGLHLKAVSERVKGLTAIATGFCKALAQIIVTVMEQFKNEVVAGSDYGKVSKNDTHSMIAKKVRDTQRKFQSALLGYIKLLEVLALLNKDMLPALRDAYSELVAEGILMKKRMKGYFQALPEKNSCHLNKVGRDLKDYIAFGDESVQQQLQTVGATDIRAALTELLPVIAREAYFTSALFGSGNKDQDGREKKRNFENTKDQDGREKKRNFENAKAAVDNSSQHFRYYINRTCGITDGVEIGDGKATTDVAVQGDPLLSLVASICLNEVMDNYVDREKKGGDHSLSLAYVRATILDLRKRADKQWVVWVEKQIVWIKLNEGVPLTGKRAGVFPSFANFPVYLDHVLSCCRHGKEDKNYSPDIGGIKVVNYYMQRMASTLLESLRECAARETNDKQYASNVMIMENAYYFMQSMKKRGPLLESLFNKQITRANAMCKESTDAYLGWMIKREFTALHELFSRISKIRKDVGDKEVAKHVPKPMFVRTLGKEANRTILKEKIWELYLRMEKHLSEEGGLLPIAWKALVKVLYEWFGRWEKLSSEIYKHKLDPGPVDVVRIAKAAGGGTTAKRNPQETGEFGLKSILALGNKMGSGDLGE